MSSNFIFSISLKASIISVITSPIRVNKNRTELVKCRMRLLFNEKSSRRPILSKIPRLTKPYRDIEMDLYKNLTRPKWVWTKACLKINVRCSGNIWISTPWNSNLALTTTKDLVKSRLENSRHFRKPAHGIKEIRKFFKPQFPCQYSWPTLFFLVLSAAYMENLAL